MNQWIGAYWKKITKRLIVWRGAEKKRYVKDE
jgi:hypothetical protein